MTTPPTGKDYTPVVATDWSERPFLVAAMFNPALVASVLCESTGAYRGRSSTGMPWVLSFVIIPLALHRSTRQALPATTHAHLTSWLTQQPLLRAGFPARAQSLVAPVREGLRFALRHGVMELQDDLLVVRKRLATVDPQHEELQDVLRAARLLGRWLARSDTPSVFAALGVTP